MPRDPGMERWREEETVDFFFNAPLTCQHWVTVMVVLASAVLFVCVWAAGGAAWLLCACDGPVERYWVCVGLGLGSGGGVGSWCSVYVAPTLPPPYVLFKAPPFPFCPCVSRPCALCASPGSYSLFGSGAMSVRHHNSLRLLCVAMCWNSFEGLVNSPFLFRRLCALYSSFFLINVLLLFDSRSSHLTTSSVCYTSPLSVPSMKWQLRGCQCGFSSLLILFQRDLEIQH